MKKVALIPLDNRPVCYSLPAQIGEINNYIKVLLPPRELLGDLNQTAKIDNILNWLDNTLMESKISFLACNLDTIAYGGLIPSRRGIESLQDIKHRIKNFSSLIKNHKSKNPFKIYVFSSIMRISDSNINEEEKEYWDKYGKLIFKYSYLTHKSLEINDIKDKEELINLKKLIPENILDDYLQTRSRNFKINKHYLEVLNQGLFDYLVFSKDDSAPWGVNIQEAKSLENIIKKENLETKSFINTGADEIVCSLLIRGIIEAYKRDIKIFPIFSDKKGKNIISRYEDKTIYNSAKSQIKTCGLKLSDHIQDSDLILLIHTPKNKQNDQALNIYNEESSSESVNFCIEFIKNSSKPVLIADVFNANGADSNLVEKLLSKNLDLTKIYAYAAWNTTSNTLGSSIATGVSRYIAENNNSFNFNTFKKAILTRFVDDWAYQSIVRNKIRKNASCPDLQFLKENLEPFIFNVAQKLELSYGNISLSFPWDRSFEVEISID